jgi:hypothetical protein
MEGTKAKLLFVQGDLGLRRQGKRNKGKMRKEQLKSGKRPKRYEKIEKGDYG